MFLNKTQYTNLYKKKNEIKRFALKTFINILKTLINKYIWNTLITQNDKITLLLKHSFFLHLKLCY